MVFHPKKSGLHVHSATASVQEPRPSALYSELAFRAIRVSDSSPSQAPGPFPKLLLLATRPRRDLGVAHLHCCYGTDFQMMLVRKWRVSSSLVLQSWSFAER